MLWVSTSACDAVFFLYPMIYVFGEASFPPLHEQYTRRQVHGTRCVEVVQEGQNCGDADGFWTRQSGLKVSVATADCVPILLFHTEGKAVAALHAGWRGTYARIVARFFKSLPIELARPQDWHAVLGPSIRANCYEVSEELITQFKNEFSEMDPKLIEPLHRHLDVTAVILHQLRQAGIASVQVHQDCSRCTQTESGEFKYRSYRRGDRYSRQFSWIAFDTEPV